MISCLNTIHTFPDPNHLLSPQQGLRITTLTETHQTFLTSPVLMSPDSECVSQSIWHHQHHGTIMSLVMDLRAGGGCWEPLAAPVLLLLLPLCQEGMLCCSDGCSEENRCTSESRALSKGVVACCLMKE